MSQLGVKELLEAGVHFGHQTRRWNPQMKPYIFEARNGIHVIDLNQTATLLQEAITFLSKIVSKGGNILFVGTKKQAQAATKRITCKKESKKKHTTKTKLKDRKSNV